MKRNLLTTAALFLTAGVVFAAIGCRATTHQRVPSTLGTVRSSDDLLAALATPGPVELETINSADWAVPRSGLINLSHPAAVQARLEDGDEAISIFFHVLKHPTKGTFIVDTGVERMVRDDPSKSLFTGLLADAMHLEKMKVHQPLGDWLAKEGRLDGVFLTHLHLDHISGMADVPAGTPLYTGLREAEDRKFMYAFVQGTTNRALAGRPALNEWQFQPDPAGRFEGVIDVFGDGSVWALSAPGHTTGSTAYLVRTTKGAVLLTGDASHTRWGWEHDVEPGTFTNDGPRSVESFQRLRAFAKAHPEVEVRFGHQR